MADEEGEERRQPRAAAAPQQQPVDCLVQMENVSDKLKLLHVGKKFCEARDHPPLQRWCFALPGRNPSLQFQLFLDLCSWLMEELTGDANFFRVDKFDDPNTSVNKLMLSLRKVDFGADFPTSKLKQAHGEAAVSVLDYLTDKCCDKSFEWHRPEYGGDKEEEAAVDEEADVGGIEDEIQGYVEEEEIMFKEPTIAAQDPEEDEEFEENHKILKSGIDPIVWQTELERVGPRLRVSTTLGGKEWRAHIEQTKTNEEQIRTALPTTEKRLASMSRRIADAKEKISVKENYINKQFEQKKDSYSSLKDELDVIEKRSSTTTEHVNQLTNDLATISDQLDEMKGTMTDRGNSMTDTSPLVQIKQALKSIKTEVVSFDLQIGVVSHTLMQQKLRSGNPKTQQKAKMRDSFDSDDDEMDSLAE